MPTAAKAETIEKLKTRVDGASALLLTEYRGLTVQQLSDLRRQLRAVAAEYRVVKNRLARRAIAASELAGVSGHLKGPTGVVISRRDPVAVAKTLHTFARTNQALVIKGGYVEGQVLAPDGLKALADLPSREALRAQLVGTLQGPLAQLVGLLTAAHRELAYVLDQRGRAAGAPGAAAEGGDQS